MCFQVVGAGPEEESRDCAHSGARRHKACVAGAWQLGGRARRARPLRRARQARLGAAGASEPAGPDSSLLPPRMSVAAYTRLVLLASPTKPSDAPHAACTAPPRWLSRSFSYSALLGPDREKYGYPPLPWTAEHSSAPPLTSGQCTPTFAARG
jgi:hypothetical protein